MFIIVSSSLHGVSHAERFLYICVSHSDFVVRPCTVNVHAWSDFQKYVY